MHRKIYEQHYGAIPDGYHIHHKDGVHANNDVNNLQCVTAQEHYDKHKAQGDYGACWALMVTGHISVTPEERAMLVSEQQKELVKQGKHPWMRREDGTSLSYDRRNKMSQVVSEAQRKLVQLGKHHMLKENRDVAMDAKKSKSLKKRYATDADLVERRRKALLGRTWKLTKEQKAKIVPNITAFTSETANICKDTIWINDGAKNKRIKSTEVIPEGFAEGRLFTPWNKGKKKNV